MDDYSIAGRVKVGIAPASPMTVTWFRMLFGAYDCPDKPPVDFTEEQWRLVKLLMKSGYRRAAAEWGARNPQAMLEYEARQRIDAWADPAELSVHRHEIVSVYLVKLNKFLGISDPEKQVGIGDLKEDFDQFMKGTAFKRWLAGQLPRPQARTNHEEYFNHLFDPSVSSEHVAALAEMHKKARALMKKGDGRKTPPARRDDQSQPQLKNDADRRPWKTHPRRSFPRTSA